MDKSSFSAIALIMIIFQIGLNIKIVLLNKVGWAMPTLFHLTLEGNRHFVNRVGKLAG